MHLIHAKKFNACVTTKKIMLENHTSACNHIELGGNKIMLLLINIGQSLCATLLVALNSP